MPEIRKYLASLLCRLSNDDLRQYGQDLAIAVQQCTDEEIRQGVTRKLMKETLEQLEVERDRLARLVADGVEKRQVECIVQADFISNKAYTMRMDTGEVIDERALKPEEQQLPLGITEAEQIAQEMEKELDVVPVARTPREEA
jgi:signal transduction histidine kinase